MLLGQLLGRLSPRDIGYNIGAQRHRLYHIGSSKLSRTTRARINEDQTYQLYDGLFRKLLWRCSVQPRCYGYRFTPPCMQRIRQRLICVFRCFPGLRFDPPKAR